MNAPTPDPEFGATIQLLLFVLGGAMTIGLVGFVIWLVRQMFREERARLTQEREGDDGQGVA